MHENIFGDNISSITMDKKYVRLSSSDLERIDQVNSILSVAKKTNDTHSRERAIIGENVICPDRSQSDIKQNQNKFDDIQGYERQLANPNINLSDSNHHQLIINNIIINNNANSDDQRILATTVNDV